MNVRVANPGASRREGARRLTLWRAMVEREVSARYRGSLLGLAWSLVNPLIMLGVCAFVFGSVFSSRWGAEEASGARLSTYLFAGMILFWFFSEVLTRAPTLILSNANYVRKVVFPLEILPPVTVGSALVQLMASYLVLFVFVIIDRGAPPLTALLLPFVLAPFFLLTLGLSWLIAALGVYVRDLAQAMGVLMSALMFLSPVFYPMSALPEWVRGYLFLNPLTIPIEQTRLVLIEGHAPAWLGLLGYAGAAVLIAALGYFSFRRLQRGFADVL